MKIAVWHNLPSGGAKRALYDHVKGLVERGHTVESWCPPTADQKYLPLGQIIKENIIDLKIEPAKYGKIINRFDLLVRTLRQQKSLEEHCQTCALQMGQNFDILFANACVYTRVPSISQFVPMPAVLYLPEPYRWLYEALPDLPWLALPKRPAIENPVHYFIRGVINTLNLHGSRIQAREEVQNAKLFKSIYVNSFYSRESVLRAYGLNANVCYLGIDTTLFKKKELQKEYFVLGVGAIVPEKNIGFVIRAISHIPAPRPKLVWVGNFALPPYLDEIRSLALELAVEFEPQELVSDEELVNLYNKATVFAYAPRLEPFGFTPLEANACGTPVVAVAEGGPRETIKTDINGILVEHDPRQMGAAIHALLKDEQRLKTMGDSAQVYVREHWGLKQAIDRLEQLLFADAMCK